MTRLQAALGGGLALLVGLVLIAALVPHERPSAPQPEAADGSRTSGNLASGDLAEPGRDARALGAPRGASFPRPVRAPASPPLQSVTSRQIGGRVQDEAGRPLAGVPVALLDPGSPAKATFLLQTDAAGQFRLDLPQGARGASVLKLGGRTRPALHVQAWPGRAVLVVLASGGILEGRVLNAQGQGVPGRVLARGGDWAEETAADATGSFRFRSAPAGLVDLLARPAPSSGAIPGRSEAIVRPGQTSKATLRCPEGQTLRGRIETSAGAPAAGAQLLIWSEVGSARDARQASCAADGTFLLAGLVPGELLLCARLGDESEGPLAVLVPLGADPDTLEVRLQANGRPQGRVVDGEGQPIAAAQLSLSSAGVRLLTLSDKEGNFGFESAPSGDYQIVVRKSDHVTLKDQVRFLPGGPRLWVELLAGASVTGQVLAPDGSPLAGAIVDAQAPDSRPARTDAEGHFRLTQLPPGGVRIRARAEGYGAGVADLALTPGESVRQDLVVVPPAKVSGQVFDGEGAPLADAVIWVTGPGDERQGRSDAEGKFQVRGLGTGPYLVSATKAGFQSDRRDQIGPGSYVQLFLEAVYPLRGEVRSLQGDPVHAVLVSPAEAPDEAQLFEGSRFAILVGAETRQVIVRARAGPAHHGHGPSFLSPLYVNVPRGGGEVKVDLPPGQDAEGVINDAGGRPLPGVAVLFGHQREELLGGEAGRLYLMGLSEDEGRFDIAGIPPAGIKVTLSHPEHGPLVTQLLPGEGQSFRLPPGSVLSGQVVNLAGNPVSGAPIVIAGPVLRRTTSDSAGRYRAQGLAAGRYLVTRVDTQESAEVGLVAGETAILNLRGRPDLRGQ